MDHENDDDWRVLYTAQRKSLVDYAARLTGARDAAEDLVQEAFLICISTQERNYAITKAFLFTIVRNLVHNHHRRQGVRATRHPDDYPWWARYQATETPETQVMALERAKIAAQAIGALAPKVRQAVEMYRFDGLKLEEIALELNVSVSTAHRLLKEGMETLWVKMDFDA